MRGCEPGGTAGVRAAPRGRARLTRGTGAHAGDSARSRPAGRPENHGARECAALAAGVVGGGRGCEARGSVPQGARMRGQGWRPGGDRRRAHPQPPLRETGCAARAPPLDSARAASFLSCSGGRKSQPGPKAFPTLDLSFPSCEMGTVRLTCRVVAKKGKGLVCGRRGWWCL